MVKNVKVKKNGVVKHTNSLNLNHLENEIQYFIKIIQNTILYVQKHKTFGIISSNNVYNSVNNLTNIYNDLNSMNMCIEKSNSSNIYNKLIEIREKLVQIFKYNGTKNIEDILNLYYGSDFIKQHCVKKDTEKYDIISKYCHPTSFITLPWKENNSPTDNVANKVIAKNRIVEDHLIVEKSETLECFDMARTNSHFQTKVYGLKISFQNPIKKETLIIKCLIDNITYHCISNKFINNKIKLLHLNKPKEDTYSNTSFIRFVDSLTLKQLLIYSNEELYHKFIGCLNQNILFKQKTVSTIIKEFVNSELFKQRTILIQLLLKHNNPEFKYLSYLLYDLLSNDSNGDVDTYEQTLLYDSLPWNVKKFFRDAMTNTIKYTNNLSNFSMSDIPIEQQICMLKASDNVKEKAMVKLKEIKAKSDDSGSKARQFLDGLLKIPFGVYRKEELLDYITYIKKEYHGLITYIREKDDLFSIEKCNSNIDIMRSCFYIKNTYMHTLKNKQINRLTELYTSNKRDHLIANICYINSYFKQKDIANNHICHSGKKISYMKEQIINTINKWKCEPLFIKYLIKKYKNYNINIDTCKITNTIEDINNKWGEIGTNISKVTDTLNDAIYGHTDAKRQIERVIGQWVAGEETGYCFGFEGPPGIGKTSLARKGLVNCLKNENGESRPFAFIALGGASNGSTLSGHNYTYVGSTWGKIVDVLMETKCMNPIIFIDELDKISRTEQGKEVIGILTHLVDYTQNKSFQDKYFAGIDIDLSKVLFIFSYNDPSLIDKILLDRIHRVKFNHLTLEDKLVICNKYILPELEEKLNLQNNVEMTETVLTHIIENYTNESGVRKLKEILFEIYSEINLEYLNNYTKYLENTPTVFLTQDIIDIKYLKKRHKITHKKIHLEPDIGIINGLWANALGMGGIIPIECNFFPSTNFLDFKLTGLQGDVMKESMNVAKTLAWKLTSSTTKKTLLDDFEKVKSYGLHIHCPEGAIPKDGPSAGTAITVVLFSRLNNIKIPNHIAITGEIDLRGKVTAIGGLDLKILGGIRAGVTTFLFPEENIKDFNLFKEEHNDKSIFEKYKYIPVNNINNVLQIVFGDTLN
jgi:SpoVK/Ycf46/Vps4 family AAA+-type ATPase